MGVQVQVGVPTPVLTEGPLQCGADGAGARRGRGKCAEQAHHNQQKSKVSEGLHDAKYIFMSGAAPGGGSRSVYSARYVCVCRLPRIYNSSPPLPLSTTTC